MTKNKILFSGNPVWQKIATDKAYIIFGEGWEDNVREQWLVWNNVGGEEGFATISINNVHLGWRGGTCDGHETFIMQTRENSSPKDIPADTPAVTEYYLSGSPACTAHHQSTLYPCRHDTDNPAAVEFYCDGKTKNVSFRNVAGNYKDGEVCEANFDKDGEVKSVSVYGAAVKKIVLSGEDAQIKLAERRETSASKLCGKTSSVVAAGNISSKNRVF